MNITAAIADNIRAEMARKRVSQREVAERLGISQPAIANRLSGRVPIDVNELHAIAALLGVEATDLMNVSAA